MKIEIHIERLVLDGLPVQHAQVSHVRTAIEAELIRLVSSGQLAPELLSGGAFPSMRVGTIAVNPQSAPRSVGRDIGAALYQGIGRPDHVR